MTKRLDNGPSLLTDAGVGRLVASEADVGAARERRRQLALRRLALVLAVLMAWLWWRLLHGDPIDVRSWHLPTFDPFLFMASLLLLTMVGVLLATTIGAGRSPHVLFRPEQIDVTLDDVRGVDAVKEDVVRSLNLFLAHRAFTEEMGGTPRRGLLFEGLPGTGKTHMAKAMAREAGVPFLFVSATSFQSMYYGATARKIRSYFRELRKAARRDGGAIGFIEEIDAIAVTRRGMSAVPAPSLDPVLPYDSSLIGHTSCGWHPPATVFTVDRAPAINRSTISEGTGGVVNELLVQMQSFNEPSGSQKAQAWLIEQLNALLPAHRQLRRPAPVPTNVLVIAATNRADNLDPALLRPGRFDRRLTFDPPGRVGRRELVDHFLARKAHVPELDDDAVREHLAALTQGYTPVMIEHLFDEALVNALRRGDRAMTVRDIERARLTEEIGLGQPVQYTDQERTLIATHEAGHATTAWLIAPERRLEVLTIIKRRDALGLLAHGDRDEVFTRSRHEMLNLIRIAMGGMVAEELFVSDVSTGPGGDLVAATTVAAQMVGVCGMDDSLVSFQAVQGAALSDTNIVGRVLGDPQGRAAVERLLHEQKQQVHDLLAENMHLVAALRDALVSRHELIGAEITSVLEAAASRHKERI
ncbi:MULTISPECIES: AAA family ATPase [unclassified Nocardioides]|uniref:AAA family ATPase n=1 Tax=unclassified Nocardioides TaxID=2615069 RepID=UPI0019100FA3|nr:MULTISPECIES: AAA family ATPase [unclassified Nocardioides]